MSKLSKILIFFVVITAFLAPQAWATERTFPAGSYIIPMDSVYQPEADGGIFEAYGLAFDLLENGATVYWIINETKTTINGPDITIFNSAVSPVVTGFAGTTIATTITDTIIYSGAPWVIVPGEGLSQSAAEAILGHPDWSSVDIHVAGVPFTANVSRELTGVPPKIALLNNEESTASGSGNAQILESYLKLAGICSNTYDIVTPNQVRDNILLNNAYTLMWAPHFTAYSGWNGGSAADADTIVQKVRDFLAGGNSIFAECASIEVFEHSPNGHFITTNGINHDGGTMDTTKMVYADLKSPFPQIGNFNYVPEGGHLHNWKPFLTSNTVGEAYPFTPVPTSDSAYNSSVTRFTHDDADGNLATTGDQWDYYTGGRIDGDATKGYVVYLGGHKYVNTGGSCLSGSSGTGGGGDTSGVRTWDIEYKEDISDETFTFVIKYTPTGGSQATLAVTPITMASHAVVVNDTVLKVDFTNAQFASSGGDAKKILGIKAENLRSTDISIDDITFTWSNGAGGQKFKKLKDTTDTSIKICDDGDKANGFACDPAVHGDGAYTLMGQTTVVPPVGGTIGGCVDNSGCTWKNTAGVRYVLNTLFNLQFTTSSTTFIRSSPVVLDNILYQGTFDYPSYGGHFNAFNVGNVGGGAVWDAADNVPAAGSRTLYTTVDGTTLIPFTTGELATNSALQTALNLSVTYAVDSTVYTTLVDKVRGQGLGAVEHSAGAIVKPWHRSNPSRSVMAYFGTLLGVLEAFDVDSLHGGSGTSSETWGFIPQSQLASLQNVRSEPNSIEPYPGVDSSPTVAELFMDTDNDPSTPGVWRTVMTTLNGKYGAFSSVVAMDITDPTAPTLIGEYRGKDTSNNLVMGGGLRTSVGTTKDSSGNIKNVVFAATNKLVDPSVSPPELGGIQVFAFDLATGNQLWRFTADYVGTQNEIPGAITIVDTTRNGYVDAVMVGDMDGRLWEINAITGSNDNGTGVPLFNGGSGASISNAGVDYPIGPSPTVALDANNNFVAIFGTGGTDWAPADASHIHSIIALDFSNKSAPSVANGAGTVLWQQNLSVGEKVWGSPTIANGLVFVNTSFGTLESADPTNDLSSTTQQGKTRAYDLNTGALQFSLDTGNQRGSVYIRNSHAYGSTLDGNVVQVGDGNFSSGTSIDVNRLSWEEQ